MSGAAVLTAGAAMRSGAGMVTLGIPRGINNAVIRIKPAEVMTLPLPQTHNGTLSFSGYKQIKDFIRNIDILVIGPGLGRDNSTQRLARRLIAEAAGPTVIDADGLNALAGHLDLLKSKTIKILTPHPGEMARLSGISVAKVESRRKEIARKFASGYNVAVVLKGHRTVVSGSRGDLYINQTGNPGMATAGSGDVLTGMIAAFLGQGLSAFEAAKFGVYLHGLAGDLAAKDKTQPGMIASDIIDNIPRAMKFWKRG